VKRKADVIVVGLGAIGSAVLYQLASRRIDVLGERPAPAWIRGDADLLDTAAAGVAWIAPRAATSAPRTGS
jgi:glycine/D-amino acid oxidase-like deaminating enzyme